MSDHAKYDPPKSNSNGKPGFQLEQAILKAGIMDYRQEKPESALYRELFELPKIELHRHLEGSLRLGTIAAIAHQYDFELPGYDIDAFRSLVQIVPDDRPDADIFLSKFITLRHMFFSPEVIDRVTYEAVADAAAENIIYMELRFTPIALGRKGNYPYDEVTDWVIAAVKRAEKDFGIDVGLIVSMNRHEPVELGEEFVDIAIERMDQGVLAVDLAGAEHLFPGKPFAHIFQKAHAAGLGVTIHAGEWAGADSIREAITVLGATRLGHGVRILEDEVLFQLAVEQEIALEVCPTSNVQTGVVKEAIAHPLGDLYRRNALTTINTDDPSISAINLTDEMVFAVENLGFNIADIKHNILHAALASFLPQDQKKALISRLSEELSITHA